MPLGSTHGSTSDEKFTNQKVDISDLKLFGCPVMVHVPKANRRKLDEKPTTIIFVGYDSRTKGYRIIKTSNRKLNISRDVKFLDHSTQPAQKYLDPYETDDLENNEDEDAQIEFHTPNTSSTPINVSQRSDNSAVTAASAGAGVNTSENIRNAGDDTDNRNEGHDDSQSETETTLVGGASAKHSDYKPDERVSTGRRSMINTRFRSHRRSVSASGFNLNSHLALFIEPTTVTEALKSAESESWKAAMKTEMQSFIENETWKLVPLPSDQKAIRNKWLSKVKRDTDGQISK